MNGCSGMGWHPLGLKSGNGHLAPSWNPWSSSAGLAKFELLELLLLLNCCCCCCCLHYLIDAVTQQLQHPTLPALAKLPHLFEQPLGVLLLLLLLLPLLHFWLLLLLLLLLLAAAAAYAIRLTHILVWNWCDHHHPLDKSARNYC